MIIGTREPRHQVPRQERCGTRYACPMHPEIVRDARGSCPKCGMTLIPILEAVLRAAEYTEDRAEAWRADAKTVVFFAIDGAAAGMAAVADPIKESTPEAIAALKRTGVRIVMVTGDSRAPLTP